MPPAKSPARSPSRWRMGAPIKKMVECPFCNTLFHPRGITNHRTACQKLLEQVIDEVEFEASLARRAMQEGKYIYTCIGDL